MLVGANNAGKSNIINALRCFYEDIKWSDDDLPKKGKGDDLSWVELTFALTDTEWASLKDEYKKDVADNSLVLRRYFAGEKAKTKQQSNIYAIVNGNESDTLFYGAKNIGTAKCGTVIYIPASTTPSEQMKMTGASPLRNMLNFMLKKTVAKSSAYTALGRAFMDFNKEAKQESGFLAEIANPINGALCQWNVKFDMSVNPISPEDITKSLVKYSFIDTLLGDSGSDLDRFGHGFQRSVIYELIRISPTFHDITKSEKKEFDPDLTLLLFEEPEAYLHPAQQENMAYHLRRLGTDSETQVIVTSHSPVLVAKNSGDLCQICRVQKGQDAVSKIYQIKTSDTESILKSGGDVLKTLQEYVADASISEDKKSKARRLIESAPATQEVAAQHEKFRLQLWLDSDRASMFFADKVLLVEGATEKALFNYLLANDWHDFATERICIVDALGKFNFHRFLRLFEAFGISHGIMFDNDSSKDEHVVINQFIRDRKNAFTLANPVEFSGCLETHLGLSLPGRDDQKPIQILKALEDGTIVPNKLSQLKTAFVKVLSISTPVAETRLMNN